MYSLKGIIDIDQFRAYNRILFNNCIYQSSKKINLKSNNLFAKLRNQKYIEMQPFLMKRNEEYTVYTKLDVDNCI